MILQEFNDFDAYLNALQDANVHSGILDRVSQPQWKIVHLNLNGVHLQLGREGSGIIVEGSGVETGYSVVVPVTEAAAHSINGRLLDDESIVVLEPGCEICFAVRAPHDWFSIFIPTSLMPPVRNPKSDVLSSRNRNPASEDSGRTLVVRRNGGEIDRLRSVAHRLGSAARTQPEFLSDVASAGVAQRELLVAVKQCLGEEQPMPPAKSGRAECSRQEVVRLAMAWLESQKECVMSTLEMANATGVSDRTLRAAFKDYFGVGPLRYLKLRQLHQIRRALIQSEPGATTVAAILTRYGVWEFGRFAGEYRHLFRERPSDTLSRSRLSADEN